MSLQYMYIVHANTNPESPIIFEGMSDRIKNKFFLDKNQLYAIFHHHDGILRDEHFIERIPVDEYEALKAKNQKDKAKQRKFDLQIQTIELMLDVHGNTIIFGSHKKILGRLEKDGYHVKATYEPKRVIKGKGLNCKRKYVYDECWILELIRKDQIKDV